MPEWYRVVPSGAEWCRVVPGRRPGGARVVPSGAGWCPGGAAPLVTLGALVALQSSLPAQAQKAEKLCLDFLVCCNGAMEKQDW